VKFAVIDLGTNTFNLLIVETSSNNKTFNTLLSTKISVKLGENAINLGYIADAPFQRGIQALVTFKNHITDYQIETVFAFATSAIRSSSNGHEFVSEAFKQTQINITVIDGDEEAELIYHGSKMAVNLTSDISLIMDIGGGSTEFILANNQTIFWKHSFLLGAARIFQKFNISNPMTELEELDIKNYLKKELAPLLLAVEKYKPIELIGSSGAFDSVVDLIAEQCDTPPINDIQTEYNVDLVNYKIVSELIKKSTTEQRQNLKGLVEMRVDMIIISILLIDFILNQLTIKKLRVSTYSLKEGVISKKMDLLA
jgi:exopolyphosphatase/guanosine-5'-triphosphate,3'-diphosphate pyrophosphatase